MGNEFLWPNLKYYSGDFLEGLRKTTENFAYDGRPLD
jgi:hypothetical protein